jgi:hypothetical protein
MQSAAITSEQANNKVVGKGKKKDFRTIIEKCPEIFSSALQTHHISVVDHEACWSLQILFYVRQTESRISNSGGVSFYQMEKDPHLYQKKS